VQSLVAGAVPSLVPEDVTVIDAGTGRVVSVDPANAERAARSDRVAEARAAVENLLAARVGEGRYVVELSIETREDRETITERLLDPASRVVLSTDTEERTNTERGAAAGVTVASNLPDGDAAGGESEASGAETRERVNYDFSATERRVERAPGGIERITVAVMVDGLRGTAEDGTPNWAPRAPEELATIRELVQSAVGFDEGRGDVVTVHSMEFDLPPEAAPAPTLSLPWLTGGQATRLAIAGLLALVAIAVLAFLVRPTVRGLLAPQPVPAGPGLPAPGPAGAATAAAPDVPDPLDELGPGFAPAFDPRTELPDLSDLAALPDLGSGAGEEAGDGVEHDDPVARLRQLIEERREETVEVLRGWIEQAPETPR
jgi:flagellar M-ring protein FliF